MARRHWLRGGLRYADPATGDAGDEAADRRDDDGDPGLPTRPAPSLPPWFHLLGLDAAAELETCAEVLARLRKLDQAAQQRALHFVITHLEAENGETFMDFDYVQRQGK